MYHNKTIQLIVSQLSFVFSQIAFLKFWHFSHATVFFAYSVYDILRKLKLEPEKTEKSSFQKVKGKNYFSQTVNICFP